MKAIHKHMSMPRTACRHCQQPIASHMLANHERACASRTPKQRALSLLYRSRYAKYVSPVKRRGRPPGSVSTPLPELTLDNGRPDPTHLYLTLKLDMNLNLRTVSNLLAGLSPASLEKIWLE